VATTTSADAAGVAAVGGPAASDDVANEDKASLYQRLQRRAALAATLLDVTFLVLVSVTGTAASLGASLDAALGSRALTAASFAAVLLLAHELLALPLAYYRGVTLERRYGLSSETRVHWWLTHAKTLLVGGVLTIAAAVVLSALLAWSPGRWWLLASALFAFSSSRWRGRRRCGCSRSSTSSGRSTGPRWRRASSIWLAAPGRR
jgi:hypothetical protein